MVLKKNNEAYTSAPVGGSPEFSDDMLETIVARSRGCVEENSARNAAWPGNQCRDVL